MGGTRELLLRKRKMEFRPEAVRVGNGTGGQVNTLMEMGCAFGQIAARVKLCA